MRGSVTPSQGQRGSSSSSRRIYGIKHLDVITYSLLAAAAMFSVYCVLRGSFASTRPASNSREVKHMLQDSAFDGAWDSNVAGLDGKGEDYSGQGSQGLLLHESDVHSVIDSATVRAVQLQKKARQPDVAKVIQAVTKELIDKEGLARIDTRSDGSQLEHAQQPCPKVVKSNMDNPRLYHVITTAAGFSNHWQARIHYYWYKKQQAICMNLDVCDMGGFTRLLHTGKFDDLMDEVPTVVVSPLPPEIMKESSYIVLNRPYAFMEWLTTASIPEKYILMCEGDHLFMRPMPNIMNGEGQGASKFSYIVPEKYADIVRKFVGPISDEEMKTVPQIGNSPTMVSVKDFHKTALMWYNTTMDIFNDKEAHEAWNWVLEMYGYSLATYRLGQHRDMVQPENVLAHPPYDKETNYKGEPFYILHLTYPMFYKASGELTTNKNESVWGFDKREFGEHAPPRNLPAPPDIVASQNPLTAVIIRMINEATSNIPCWDFYVADKTVTSQC